MTEASILLTLEPSLCTSCKCTSWIASRFIFGLVSPYHLGDILNLRCCEDTVVKIFFLSYIARQARRAKCCTYICFKRGRSLRLNHLDLPFTAKKPHFTPRYIYLFVNVLLLLAFTFARTQRLSVNCSVYRAAVSSRKPVIDWVPPPPDHLRILLQCGKV